jgi:hypothetical protein
MQWRRLCVDVDEDNAVIGASIEFYDDSKVKPNAVVVLGRSEWNGKGPQTMVLEELFCERPVGRQGIILQGIAED